MARSPVTEVFCGGAAMHTTVESTKIHSLRSPLAPNTWVQDFSGTRGCGEINRCTVTGESN
eukprot:3603107-Pyramimonas_sp.AAC.1